MNISKLSTWLQSKQVNKNLIQKMAVGANEIIAMMPDSRLKNALVKLNGWQVNNGQVMSDKGIALLKRFEGLRLKAYQDIGGVWTIGYGHTSAAGGMKVNKGLTITNEQAEQLLKSDLERMTYPVIRRLVKVPLTQGQFDALSSFIYNLGEGQVSSSTLLRLLNNGDYIGASNEFGRWVYANSVKLDGLVRRRNDERELFNS